jgi:hypothetical protein
MKIVRLGQGEWTVYAVCVASDACPVLDFVAELVPKRGDRVLSDLREFVPNTSPQDWVRSEFSEKLRDAEDIYEFRWPTKGGGTPRVLWFYDENRVVVCSNGVDKKGKLRDDEIEFAEKTRKQYLDAKKNNRLQIVDLEDFDC